MLAERLRGESGYSLVEVMVSIMLLTIAIIPMVAMFDMGLDAATRGSNHDIARALAKKQLEQAQSLSYGTVKTSFPNAPCTFDGSGLCEVENLQDSNPEFTNFGYAIRKQYVTPSSRTFVNATEETGMMEITGEVGWCGASF